MSLFETICLSIMAGGVLILIGCGVYCLICRLIGKHKQKRTINDEISQYWKAIYTVAEKANKKALQKK